MIDNRYQILARLGQGSSSTVYKVRDQQDGKTKALKLLSKSPDFLNHELTALDQINHSGVVQFFDKGADYFTMEYVEGISLDQQQLPLKTWKPLAIDLIRALRAIHKAGWLHGDLKPSHVMCPISGGVKLLDFGLSSRQGETWAPAGTPGYIAPEVLLGQPADTHSDLYCYGVILYLVSTGRHPYTGNSDLEIFVAQTRQNPPPPKEINPHLSKKDSDFIMKLLHRDPQKRFHSAREVIDVLTDQHTKEEHPRDFQEPSMVGRTHIASRLQRLLQSVLNGQGRFILLHGEEGIGRSRLLEVIRSEGNLQGISGAFCRFKPWITSPYHQLLNTFSELFSPREKWDRHEQPHPDLLSQLAQKKLDSQPRLLLLDDLQEADATTLKALDLLSVLCEEFPLMIVACWQDSLIHGNAIHCLPESCRRQNYYDIVIPRFEKSETYDFISGILGQKNQTIEDLTHVLHHPCHGKPRHLKDALKALVKQHSLKYLAGGWVYEGNAVPKSWDFDHWQLTRLDQLPKISFQIIQIVSMAGSPAPIELLSELCHIDKKSLFNDLKDLVHHGFLRQEGWGWIPASENLREHFLTRLTDRQKNRLHRKIAKIFQKVQDPLQRALLSWPHFFHGGKSEEGMELLEQAITQLSRANQEDSALELCRSGLKLLDDNQLISTKARFLARLGNSARRHGDWEQGVQYLRQALNLESPLRDSPRLHSALAHCLVELRMTQEARWHLKETKRLDLSHELRLSRHILEAKCHFIEGHSERARQKLEGCIEMAKKSRQLLPLGEALFELGKLARLEGHYADSEEKFTQARKYREDTRSAVVEIDLERVETALMHGRLEMAEQLLNTLHNHDLERSWLKARRCRLQSLLHLQKGNYGKAQNDYARYLRLVPAWQIQEERLELLETFLEHLPLIQTAQVDWLQQEIRYLNDPQLMNSWKNRLNRLMNLDPDQSDPVQTLSEIASLLNSEKSLSRLFPLIMDQVIRVVGAERGFLMLLEPNQKELHFAAARNLDQRTIAQPSFAISASIAQKVVETGEVILTRDALNDERFQNSDSIHELKLRSILCCPLKTHEKLIGVVYVDNRSLSDKFNTANLNLLSAVADQAALSIENARLLEKNRQQNQQLIKTTRQLTEKGKRLEQTVSQQNRQLASIHSHQSPLQTIMGESLEIENLKNLIRRSAGGHLPILIQGETGSGKGLVAQAIHSLSDRQTGPFETINCGAFNPELLESELFGHVQGAFTGASNDHQGVFQQADGGTLFLDEIGDMPIAMQVKLLRVLENGEVRPVGSAKSFNVSVRILAATHRNLEDAVKNGTFRQDLYFRISGLILKIPPLRHRGKDIERLFLHFLQEFSHLLNRPAPTISPEAFEALNHYHWPGNIRELKNTVERFMALGLEKIEPHHFPQIIKSAEQKFEDFDFNEYKSGRRALLDYFDRTIVTSSLKAHQGNVSAAARDIGIERQYFHKIMKKHSVRSEDFR